MKRAMLCGVLLVAGCARPPSDPTDDQARRGDPGADGKAAARASREATQGPSPGAEMVPDPSYTPREEDRVTLIADATPGFSRASLLGDFYDSPPPGDPDLLRKLIERGEVVELEGKLPVLVIRNLDPADAREPGRHYGVEVRLLAGARKGETWFVDESAVARPGPQVGPPATGPGVVCVGRPTGGACIRRMGGLRHGGPLAGRGRESGNFPDRGGRPGRGPGRSRGSRSCPGRFRVGGWGSRRGRYSVGPASDGAAVESCPSPAPRRTLTLGVRRGRIDALGSVKHGHGPTFPDSECLQRQDFEQSRHWARDHASELVDLQGFVLTGRELLGRRKVGGSAWESNPPAGRHRAGRRF